MDNSQMNNNVDNNIQENVIQNEVIQNDQNVYKQDAQVIGKLRKIKIGNPLLAIELLGLFLVVLISLPIVNNLLSDETSFLSQFIAKIKGTPVVTVESEKRSEFADATKKNSLSESTLLKYKNLILTNFKLKGDNIELSIYSYNGILNLDENEYYMIIKSSTDSEMGYIKLILRK